MNSICSLASSDLIHNTSDAVIAKAQYSDSVLEWETTACFLEHQETRLGHR